MTVIENKKVEKFRQVSFTITEEENDIVDISMNGIAILRNSLLKIQNGGEIDTFEHIVIDILSVVQDFKDKDKKGKDKKNGN